MTMTYRLRAAASMAIHLLSSTPKGGMIIMMTPATVISAVTGMTA